MARRPQGRARRLARAAVAVTVGTVSMAAVTVGIGMRPARAVDNPPAPGLPPFVLGTSWFPADKPIGKATQVQNGSIISALVSGNTEVTKLKQGLQLPIAIVGANLVAENFYTRKPDPPSTRFSYPTRVYVQSPAGVSPAWGVLPPFTSTALAFGMIPVEVTVDLSQPRDASDLPVPLDVAVDSLYAPSIVVYDVVVKGTLDLRIRDVKVDGRPLDVGSRCGTTTSLSMVGKNPFPPVRTPEFYYPPYGGDLYGTIDVAGFSGCVTSAGEDLSAIFTSALSGKGNPVHLNQGNPGQGALGCLPDPTATPDVLCQAPDDLPVPTAPGQVPSLPPHYTPNPSPLTPPTILPPRPTPTPKP